MKSSLARKFFRTLFQTLFGMVIIGKFFLMSVYGYEYPVKNLRVTSLFGESRGDHFHAGTDFGIRQPVFPIADGEILFIKDSRDIRDVPAGVGNAVIVEHTGNIRSYYYHLEAGSIPKQLSRASTNESIGRVGNTGYSIGDHLHLNVEDIGRGVFLNPLQLFSGDVDNVSPRIVSFFFKINEKLYPIKNRRSTIRYLGPLEIYGVILDYRSRADQKIGKRVGVSELTLTIDGEVYRNYDFSTLKKDKAGLVLANDFTFKDVYGFPFNYKFGTFTPSREEHLFEITARDWQNNVSTSSYKVLFRNY